MQLLLQTEDLSNENKKMSIVKVPESVNEKLKTNNIDKMPDNNYEFSSEAENEISNDANTKNVDFVDNGNLEKLDLPSVVLESNVYNGKSDVNLNEKSTAEMENSSENNDSDKKHEKLSSGKDTDDETEVLESSNQIVSDSNKIVAPTEAEDFKCNLSPLRTTEPTSSEITNNLFNGTGNAVPGGRFSEEAIQSHCDKSSTQNETVVIAEHKKTNLSTLLNRTIENETENNLVKSSLEKVEPTTHDNFINMEVDEQPRLDFGNSSVTGSPLAEIKTENDAQCDAQDVEMASVEESNEAFKNNIGIKKEVPSCSTEIESNDDNNIFNELEQILENDKFVDQPVSVKIENEDTQMSQFKTEKDLSDTEINEKVKVEHEDAINYEVDSSKVSEVSLEKDSQRNEKTVDENLTNSDETGEINNEGSTKTSEITETDSTNDITLSVGNDECNQSTKKNNEEQFANEVIENSVEHVKENCTNSDVSNIARLPDVVHEIAERNEEEHLSEELKKTTDKSALAHTLDILSDSDDESHKSNMVNAPGKQCIDLVDDDDVMLVDDDSMSRDQLVKEVDASSEVSENNIENVQDLKIEEPESGEKIMDNCKDDTTTTDKLVSPTIQEDDIKIQEKLDEVKLSPEPEKPLVAIDFMKYCKPILSEMTRDHLEDFCLQRIVESIVDRSNFSEVKTKLKVMSQNCEEWRKKAMMLSKQNRDLQIVLKTVQEEQKKKSAEAIAPLRITRSVGMQVYMVEPNRNDTNTNRARRGFPANRWRGAAPASGTVTGPGAGAGVGVGRGTPPSGVRGASSPAIPVPRLVPAPGANTNSPTKTARTPPPTGASAPSLSPQPQLQSAAVSSNTGRTAPTAASPAAGSVTSPAQAQAQGRSAEKRSLNGSSAGGSQSVTVDLTDDEPPTKQPARAVGSLRVVPQQQLVAQPRASAPRKVYIPISGTQTQAIRPGQTIMFKNVAPPSQRPRNPGGMWMGGAGTGTMVRLAPRAPRHPAPLPEAPKQAQPPNWKTLPPAPDLKISKVENGIVISWKIDGYQDDTWEEIASYQLYAYQETSTAPSTMLWKKIGDVKALPLPMACTLTQFMAGYKYYFAVRAVDIRSRIGPFSLPGSILLLNK